ncbi:MAG: hypothetical protein AAGE85_13075 [Pseudomonadota bacterium]
MDRLAWVVHGNDPQAREQATLVAKHQKIDWDEIREWSASEGVDETLINDVRAEAGG